MRFIFSILFITVSFAFTAAAQSQVKLQNVFEGKQVKLRIDMPSADGVDVYPERSQSLDYDRYKIQLQNGGVSIKRGSTAIIDSVEVHDRSIKVLFENQQGTESHFNLHYARIESWMLTPAALIDALNRYVEFSAGDKQSSRLVESSEFARGYVRRGVVHLGPRKPFLKAGLTTEEVMKLLGDPASVSQRTENGKVVATYEFERGEGRVLIAEFVADLLVESRTEFRSATVALLYGSNSSYSTVTDLARFLG